MRCAASHARRGEPLQSMCLRHPLRSPPSGNPGDQSELSDTPARQRPMAHGRAARKHVRNATLVNPMQSHRPHSPRRRICTRLTLLRVASALLLGGIACTASAASIYQCTNGSHAATFGDTPCPTTTHQTKREVSGQPLIDPAAPRRTPVVASSNSRSTAQARRTHARRMRKRQQPMSWECRAADGEVFYRHARCPSSVPGDGVVRGDYAAPFNSGHSRHRRTAWNRIPVHGVKVPRSEACQRIESAGASGRDGHLRDANVSTYDHLMGRDPCDAS